jgi:hypothetical protein
MTHTRRRFLATLSVAGVTMIPRGLSPSASFASTSPPSPRTAKPDPRMPNGQIAIIIGEIQHAEVGQTG